MIGRATTTDIQSNKENKQKPDTKCKAKKIKSHSSARCNREKSKFVITILEKRINFICSTIILLHLGGTNDIYIPEYAVNVVISVLLSNKLANSNGSFDNNWKSRVLSLPDLEIKFRNEISKC